MPARNVSHERLDLESVRRDELSSAQYPLEDFCSRRAPEPPQTGRMTLEKLCRLIRAGYGQGHLHLYKPWLRVTKHDYSPKSNIGHLPSAHGGGLHHYRARAERDSIILLYWLGAYDARDQYPVWPWPHLHLSHGLPGLTQAGRMPGLAEVAASAGIDHGVYPGTNIRYVASLDIVSTWRLADGTFRFVGHECKPEEILQIFDPLARVKERLELTRRYLVLAGMRQHLAHAETLPKQLMVNLDMLRPLVGRRRQEFLRQSRDYRLMIEFCTRHAYERPFSRTLDELASRTKVDGLELHKLSHLALWHQDLDHDLSQGFEPWHPLNPGGRQLKQRLMKTWSWEAE